MGHREILAGAPATIEIVMLFDVELILHDFKPGNNKTPQTATWLPHGPTSVKYAYMVAPEEYVKPSTNATPDISIYALTGDTIRWRGLSFSGNINHAGALVAVEPNGASKALKFLPPPNDVPGSYLAYNIDKKEPYDIKDFLDNRVSASVVGHGTDQYFVTFYAMEVNRRTGAIDYERSGYYKWDPEVTCLA